MQCQNCNCGEYQDGLDSCIDNGVKHKVYICPTCDDIFLEPIVNKTKHHRFNKYKFGERIIMLAVMYGIYNITYYIGSHIDKFTTIYK